jgi:hypothetical protein
MPTFFVLPVASSGNVIGLRQNDRFVLWFSFGGRFFDDLENFSAGDRIFGCLSRCFRLFVYSGRVAGRRWFFVATAGKDECERGQGSDSY